MFEIFDNIVKAPVAGADGAALQFATYLDAKAYIEANALADCGPRKVRVESRWQDREARRLSDGTYKALPDSVTDTYIWREITAAYPEHFAHMSRKQTGKIAYTETEKKGAGDVQTPIAFREYLNKYAEKDGVTLIHSHYIDVFCERFAAECQEVELRFVEDSDKMAEIMRSIGPSHCLNSCMTGPDFDESDHPYHVYGTNEYNGVKSDLVLAVLQTKGKDSEYIGRAIVWPKKKIYGRIYGQHGAVMRKLLRDIDYREGDFYGAKLKKIPYNSGCWIMPYLDGIQHVTDEGYYFRISRNGERLCNETSGYIGAPTFYCDSCEENCEGESTSVRTTRGNYDTYCEHCYENNTFYCDGYEESVSELYHESVTVENSTYCEEYAQNHFSWCEYNDEYVTSTQKVILDIKGNTAKWGLEAIAEEAFTCRVDGAIYKRETMLSPEMTQKEHYDESYICVLNDDRCFQCHDIPEQGKLDLDSASPIAA